MYAASLSSKFDNFIETYKNTVLIVQCVVLFLIIILKIREIYFDERKITLNATKIKIADEEKEEEKKGGEENSKADIEARV